jgi:hypothetical protein
LLTHVMLGRNVQVQTQCPGLQQKMEHLNKPLSSAETKPHIGCVIASVHVSVQGSHGMGCSPQAVHGVMALQLLITAGFDTASHGSCSWYCLSVSHGSYSWYCLSVEWA